MKKINAKNYVSLVNWVVALITIGACIGFFTQPAINSWYIALDRSPLTPPAYVFSIVWSILYALLGICGWKIWHIPVFSSLMVVKRLYLLQLILNWSWTPLFFSYHWIGVSLLALVAMDIIVTILVWLTYRKIPLVSFIMISYLSWLLFASYLNFYIWQHN